MTQQVLIDRVISGQQHGQAFVVPATAAPRLLPTAGDRARVVDEQRHIERADIDAELQCVGGRHAAQIAAEQILLDLPAFVGQIAAAIGPHLVGQRRVSRGQLLAGIAMNQFGRLAGAGERQRLAAGLQCLDQPGHGVVVGAAAGQRVLAQRRWIPQRKVLAAARRAVVIDHGRLRAQAAAT